MLTLWVAAVGKVGRLTVSRIQDLPSRCSGHWFFLHSLIICFVIHTCKSLPSQDLRCKSCKNEYIDFFRSFILLNVHTQDNPPFFFSHSLFPWHSHLLTDVALLSHWIHWRFVLGAISFHPCWSHKVLQEWSALPLSVQIQYISNATIFSVE